MPQEYTNGNRMFDGDEQPQAARNKPMMGDKIEADAALSGVQGSRMEAMDELSISSFEIKQRDEGNLMEPFASVDDYEIPEQKVVEVDYLPQVAREEQDVEKVADDGYVRLRLRVENGNMQVIGARAVAGPLLQENTVSGVLAYEMRLGQQRLALGAITDVGEIRSFPPPHPTDDVYGHQIIETEDYEFTVRIPRQTFTREAVANLEIDVLRPKGELDIRDLKYDAPLIKQQANVRPVAQLRGLEEADITDDALEQIRAILDDNETLY